MALIAEATEKRPKDPGYAAFNNLRWLGLNRGEFKPFE
jgi:hypothetical protein